jgi:hypothetical protein
VDKLGEVPPSFDEDHVGVGDGGTSRETRGVPADFGESADKGVGMKREWGGELG